jgi:hypothetical protein
MRLLNTSSVRVTRYGEQALDDNGNVVVTQKQVFSVTGNWQPIPNVQKGEVAKVLPEGVKIEDVLVFFTKSELKPDNEKTGFTGDEVELDGWRYKVIQERNWSVQLPRIRHREFLLVRKTKL